MKPQIQYATTDDGARIAYWAMGDGAPYIITFSANAIDLEWQFPEAEWAYNELAKDRTVVRFDLRGEGLSSLPEERATFDDFCRDLDAVVNRLGAERYALHGGVASTKLVVRHAAAHPDRVTSLTLYRPTLASGVHAENPAVRLLAPLRQTQPALYAQLLAVIMAGLDDPEFTRRYADLLFARLQPMLALGVLQSVDVTGDVADVSAPVLVLHRNTREFDINISRAIASAFSDGRLAVVEGTMPLPWDAPIVSTIREFLAQTSTHPRIAQVTGAQPDADGLALIMFADIVDSTALTERLGDAPFRKMARELDTALRAIIAESGGAAVEGKLLGDGVLATFSSAAQAIAAGIGCAAAGRDLDLPLHVGLHAGDVLREDGNVYGGAVNIASRIAAEAGASEVLVSDIVRGLARTSASVSFEDRGERELKGVEEPVRVFAVRQQD